MKRKILIAVGGIMLLVVIMAAGFILHIRELIAAAPKPTPQTVSTATASVEHWQPHLETVGTLTAAQGVDLATEAAGLVIGVHVNSGEHVKAGALLVELNTAPDEAAWRSLEAARRQARIVLDRDRAQLQVRAISQAQLDADTADLDSKSALAAQERALIVKKSLRAPFTGHVGITDVALGQYLNAGDKIATLQSVDPIFIDFYVPQAQSALAIPGAAVKVTVDAYPNRTFDGSIVATNAKVDTATRNLQVRARLANHEGELTPGMYAGVQIPQGHDESWVTLPQTALTYNSYGATVFVLQDQSATAAASATRRVQQVFVTTGPTRGDQVAIVKGLAAGQQVVTSGQLKLKNGAEVLVNNTVVPANAPAPTPQED